MSERLPWYWSPSSPDWNELYLSRFRMLALGWSGEKNAVAVSLPTHASVRDFGESGLASSFFGFLFLDSSSPLRPNHSENPDVPKGLGGLALCSVFLNSLSPVVRKEAYSLSPSSDPESESSAEETPGPPARSSRSALGPELFLYSFFPNPDPRYSPEPNPACVVNPPPRVPGRHSPSSSKAAKSGFASFQARTARKPASWPALTISAYRPKARIGTSATAGRTMMSTVPALRAALA
mmetsp:Transcript_12345/g.41087  ORF Transcript_12345/g.41087 Transcript_12345/m.41087 type:complete len:237 (-) Transcript_12345:1522-2232(-)